MKYFSILLLLLMISACKKEEVDPFVYDFRYQYTGEFKVKAGYRGDTLKDYTMKVTLGDSVLLNPFTNPQQYRPGIVLNWKGQDWPFAIVQDGKLEQDYNGSFHYSKGGFVGMDSINLTFGSTYHRNSYECYIKGRRK